MIGKNLLLKSGVLLGKECLWQFIFNTTTSTYGIEKIGKYKKQDLPNTYIDDTTNNIRTIYGHYAIPLGRFSDLAEGLGSGDVQANLSTT